MRTGRPPLLGQPEAAGCTGPSPRAAHLAAAPSWPCCPLSRLGAGEASLRRGQLEDSAQGPPAGHLWSAPPSTVQVLVRLLRDWDLEAICTRALTQGRPVRVAAPAARQPAPRCPLQMAKREAGVGTGPLRPPEPPRPACSPARPRLPVPRLRLALDPYCPFRMKPSVCPHPGPEVWVHPVWSWGVAQGRKGSLLRSSAGREDSHEPYFLQLMFLF